MSVEARGTYIFYDNTKFLDTTVVDTDWNQAQIGVKASRAPNARRHLTGRAGFAYADAQGNLNVVPEEGRYFGGYLGIGFESDLTEHFTMGPSLTGLILKHENRDSFDVVPQLAWHFIWNF